MKHSERRVARRCAHWAALFGRTDDAPELAELLIAAMQAGRIASWELEAKYHEMRTLRRGCPYEFAAFVRGVAETTSAT